METIPGADCTFCAAADAAIAGARLAATASAAMVISVKPIHFMVEGLSRIVTGKPITDRGRNEKQARRRTNLFQSANRITAEAPSPMAVMMVVMVPPPMAAVVPATPVMVMAPVMMMPVPAHIGRHLLPGILLHRRRSARIDQRNSLSALDWSRDQKHCADSRKTQSSRSDHSDSSSHAIHVRAVPLPSLATARCDARIESCGR